MIVININMLACVVLAASSVEAMQLDSLAG